MSAGYSPCRGSHWSFETDSGFHAQVRDGMVFVRNRRREPHMVAAFEEIVVEIGEPVRLRDESGWSVLDIGTVANTLHLHDHRR
jgi:hypothetical protein